LFCGDTLFTGGCGRLFEGTPEQMYRSLEKLRALPDETRVYCAHEYTLACLAFARVAEPDNANVAARIAKSEDLRRQNRATVPSTIGLEKRTNPFLRSHIQSVAAGAARFAGKPLASDEEVFAAVRAWKDALD
jgi:hydroxyacylglutathione hydrolase